MNVASLELCKELYAVSGWEDSSDFFASQTERLDWVQNTDGSGWHLPAYDVGYLLRKLPHFISLTQTSGGYSPDGWLAEKRMSQDFHYIGRAKADTPEDAACKLAIELFKQGVLAR